MISNTNADCKILKMTVSETTATITLLVFAIKSTESSVGLKAYVKDNDDSDPVLASAKTYWIDTYTYSTTNTSNISTNKYKEIILNIDITKGNTSVISQNRWVRQCYILLKKDNDTAWTSDVLTLVSDEFEIPKIKKIHFNSVNKKSDDGGNVLYNIKTNFTLSYSSEKDFNYNNRNFSAYVEIRSASTNLVLETKEISTSSLSLDNSVVSTNFYKEREPYVIDIIITNKNNEIFYKERRTYKPCNKYTSVYIKKGGECKQIEAVYIQTENTIRTNYNNAYINKPEDLVPFVYAYRDTDNRKIYLYINTKLSKETYFTGNSFDIYINGTFTSRINNYEDYTASDGSTASQTTDVIVVELSSSYYDMLSINVILDGYYIDSNGTKFESKNIYEHLITDLLLAADDIFVNDKLLVSGITLGYLIDNKFYAEDKTTQLDTPEGELLGDYTTRKVYTYDSSSDTIKII